MDHLPDIPTKFYIRAIIWLARLLRKRKRFRHIVVDAKNRFALGTLSKLHLEAAHAVRTFAINRDQISDNPETYLALEGLANGYRNVFADILEVHSSEDIHCTIKLCASEQNVPKEDWEVYTIARSTPCYRPSEFGIKSAHKIGHNSDFAALCGAEDRKNKWYPNVYSCFICNDLRSHANYDCSRDDWNSFYTATAVFPIRYRHPKDKLHNIIGFLTFDTLDSSLFGDLPCIFHEGGNKLNYERALNFTSVFHLGGILSDVLALSFYPLTI